MTNLDERSGLPDISYDEDIRLLSDFIHADDKLGKLARAKEFIKRRFPNVNFGKIDPIGFSKKTGNETEIVTFGKKGFFFFFFFLNIYAGWPIQHSGWYPEGPC